MHGRARLISDKYFRYIVTWLLFGVLGFYIFSQWKIYYGITSAFVAFLLTFGLDIFKHFIVSQKVMKLVKEEPLIIMEAQRLRGKNKGYLVVTKNFVLYVPLFRKVKTVFDANKIIRYKTDGETVEITVKFPNRFRTFSFYVLSTKKLMPILKEIAGEPLPYKYDHLQNNIYL